MWQACEIGHWAMLGFYLGGILAPSSGGDARAYWLGVLMRTGGLMWLIGVTAMSAADPESADLDAGAPDLGDGHPVEGGRGEADADVDVLADLGHSRA